MQWKSYDLVVDLINYIDINSFSIFNEYNEEYDTEWWRKITFHSMNFINYQVNEKGHERSVYNILPWNKEEKKWHDQISNFSLYNDIKCENFLLREK